MIELKPCPFCGEKPFICKGLYLWHAFCTTRWCERKDDGVYYPTKQGAIGSWNYKVEQEMKK